MAWWNPLSWFVTPPEAPVLEKEPVVEPPPEPPPEQPKEEPVKPPEPEPPAALVEADVMDTWTVLEDGKQAAVDVVKDGIAPENKYLFEIVTLMATDQVMYVVAKGDEDQPLCCGDRRPPFEVHEALLTLEEAARLKLISKSEGGDGDMLDAEGVRALEPEPEPEIVAPASLFRDIALVKSRPVIGK